MRYACRCNTYCPFPRARMKGTLPKLPAAGQQPVPGARACGAVDPLPSHIPGVYLACTSDVPEQAGKPRDLRIRLAETGRRSRRYSGRSRGDVSICPLARIRLGLTALRAWSSRRPALAPDGARRDVEDVLVAHPAVCSSRTW